MGKCWAAPLGTCQGKITGEHVFSRSIFTAARVSVEGAPWFNGVPRQIPLNAATANVLCKHHNETLGTYADTTVKELRIALQGQVRNKDAGLGRTVPYVRTPGGILIEKPSPRLHGPSFGAWLCKTHCNVMAATKQTPAIEYVRYAFECRNPDVRFYFPHVERETVHFTDQPYVTYMNFLEPGELFAIQVCGHWTVAGLQPPAQWVSIGMPFLDRVAELRFDTLTLQLDWRDDPPKP